MSPSAEAHCRRVAALACEIARRLDIAVDPVCDAALSHSAPPSLPDNSLKELLSDLSTLNLAIWSPPKAPPDDPLVTSIVEVAHAFEQGVAFSLYESHSAASIHDEIDALGLDSIVTAALRSITIPGDTPLPRLAVYPAVLFKALALLRNDEASASDIERVVRADQVMASSLLSVANAALYAPLVPIMSISRAITHIGVEAAKKVIAVAAARPLFGSSRLRGLWQHSLDVATIASRLAHTTGKADAAEAFVTGLIHDIGRLATEFLPHDVVEAHHRIAEDSQCLVLADMAVLGCDHGEFGARVIRQWALPAELVTAVGLHHRPELSDHAMSKLLYLAEFVSESDEDIPSSARMKIAMDAFSLSNMGELFERSAFDRRIASVLALAG